MIALLDYGAGNLASVQNALTALGASYRVVSDGRALLQGDYRRILMPGVGAFGDAMRRLDQTGLSDAVRSQVAQGKPFLGICLGLQLLFESSQECPGVPGLGLLPGQVVRIAPAAGCKVPHMGWNALQHGDNPLFNGLPQQPAFYFVHSYHACLADPGMLLASTQYGGQQLTAMVQAGCITAAQCHPEKSGRLGLVWLNNWLQQTQGGVPC